MATSKERALEELAKLPEVEQEGYWARMQEALEIAPLSLSELENLQTLLENLPQWRGTLEDASVALLALRLEVPVWTLNYRDLGVFTKLEFWAE